MSGKDPELEPECITDGDNVIYIYKLRSAKGKIYKQKHTYVKKNLPPGRKKLDPKLVEARKSHLKLYRKYLATLTVDEINQKSREYDYILTK